MQCQLELCVVPWTTCVKGNSCMRPMSLEYRGWRELQKLKSPSSTKLENRKNLDSLKLKIGYP